MFFNSPGNDSGEPQHLQKEHPNATGHAGHQPDQPGHAQQEGSPEELVFSAQRQSVGSGQIRQLSKEVARYP